MTSTLPLKGIRVIELCWVWSGPLLGQFLADLGAEVIKVEWFKRYDLYRTRGVERMAGKYPESIRREMSHSFHGLNRNKIGLAMDLKDPKHKNGLIDLVAQSDLIIENFTSGTLDRLGLGYENLSDANKAVVLLSLSGFGASSRLSQMRAYGLVLSALSGMEASILDPKDAEFIGSPTFVASDPNAATYGLFAAISAIIGARKTGFGSHVEISQLEAVAHVAEAKDKELEEFAETLGLKTTFDQGNQDMIPCLDGKYICIAWPENTSEQEKKHICNEIANMGREEAQKLIDNLKIKVVNIVEQSSEIGAGASAKGTLIPTVHPVTGPEDIVAAPWWIDGQRAPLRKAAPTLGEGNDYVLGTLLKWSQEERTEISLFDLEKRFASKK